MLLTSGDPSFPVAVFWSQRRVADQTRLEKAARVSELERQIAGLEPSSCGSPNGRTEAVAEHRAVCIIPARGGCCREAEFLLGRSAGPIGP